MFESIQRLDLYQKLIRCAARLTLWSYDPEGKLLSASPEASPLLERLLFLEQTFDYAREFGREQDMPLILTNSMHLIWAAAFEKKEDLYYRIHIIGPAFVEDISGKHLEASLQPLNLSIPIKREFLQKMSSLPVVSITNFLQYAIMLHYCVTDEEIHLSQIQYQTREIYRDSRPVAEEPPRRHDTWAAEQAIMEMVSEGNLNYRSVMNEYALQGSVGKLSVGDPMRQLKNTIISSVILVSRAAMRGGLYPEVAYSLSDKYIQDVEQCTQMSELSAINSTMMQDYVQRVHNLKAEEMESSFVRSCKEYVDLHVREEIDLEEMAAQLGYAQHYMSRKFKRETGDALKLYIRDRKLEYAKIMLKTTDKTIRDISEELCFCSQSYFAEHFKEKTGMTPAAYRKQATV